MSWFKNSHIDPSTGRNKRDKGPITEKRGVRPERRNGKIVSRKAWRDEQATGRPQRARWW